MVNKLKRVDMITQFSSGTAAEWNNVLVPVPDRVIVIAVDTGDVKMGDGIRLYVNLPLLFNLKSIVSLRADLDTAELNIQDILNALERINDILGELAQANHTHTFSQIVEFASNGVTYDDISLLTRAQVIRAGQGHVIRQLGIISGNTLTPNLSLGNYQKATLETGSLTINRPTAPNGTTAGEYVLFLTGNHPSTLINLGLKVNYTGGDGLIVLRDQQYKYTFSLYDDMCALFTQLITR